MNITYSQIKQIKENCDNLGLDWRDIIEAMNTQPVFLEYTLEIYDIASINQGGCASGAYMPAVTYAKALDTMNTFYDVIEWEIKAAIGGVPVIDADISWPHLAVQYVSLAVELWCLQWDEVLEGVEY